MPAKKKDKPPSVPDDTLRTAARDLIDNLPLYSLHRMTLALERSRDAVFERDLKLSSAEWRILVTVAALEPLSTKVLAQRSGVDKATASRAATALGYRRLINHGADKRDKRLVSLSMTTQGRVVCEAIVRSLKIWDEQILAALTPKLRVSLRVASEVLSDRLEELISQILAHVVDRADSDSPEEARGGRKLPG